MNNSTIAVMNGKKNIILKRLLFSFIAIFFISPVFATTYYWVGGTTTAALGATGTLSTTLGGTAVAAFTPAATDVIIFDGSDISSTTGSQTGTITFSQGGATYTIGQFILQNNATVIYSSTSSGRDLTIGGAIAGNDFVIGSGSTFSTTGSSITVNLTTGSTASISGTFNIGAGSNTHTFLPVDANSVTVNSGGVIKHNSSTSPFGTTGNANAIIFANGSTYIVASTGSSNPFGLAVPNSRVVFQTGSLCRYDASTTPSFSGRTYSNFQWNVSASQSPTGGSPVTMDNLTVSLGTLNIGMTGTGTNGCFINGSISVATGATLNFNPSSTGNINFNGNSQTISSTGTGAITLTTAANFIIAGTGVTGTLAGPVTVNSGCTWNGGSSALTENGTFTIANGGIYNSQTSVLSGSGTFIINSTSILEIGHASGIASSGATGAIQTTTRTFNAGSTYMYNGTTNQITGTGLPSSIGALTINNTGTSGNNVVSLTTSPLEIKANPATGALTLTAGIFKIGAGNIVNFNNNSSTNSIVNNGGDLATTGTGGSDGGKIVALTGSGANLTISGTGTTHFYDLSNGTSVNNGNRTIVNSGTVVINGTYYSTDNQSKWTTNSPTWATGSTLYINGNTQFVFFTNESPLWNATSGAGFPYNVTVVNVGSASLVQDRSIAGVLSFGDGTTGGNLTITGGTANAFSCGGIIINTGSTFTAPAANITVKGKFINRTGGTFTNSSGTVIMNGSGTSAVPDSIKLASGGFYNLSFTGANAYVKLYSPVTVSNVFTLPSATNSPIIETDATNILTITNTATNAIAGGYSSSYINGPAKWSLLSSGTNSYAFPLGSGTTYLPLSLNSKNTTAGNTATAQAFGSASGGTPDNSTVDFVDSAVYWSLSTSAGLGTTGSTVTLSQPTAISPYDVIAKSTTAGGSYTSLGGTVTTNGGTTGDIGTASPWFLTFAHKFIAGTITTGTISPLTYCPGDVVTVPFTYSGSLSSFTAELSGPSGTFPGTTITSTGSGSGGTGSLSATIPVNTVYGSAYRIRVNASSPSSVTGTDNGSNITVNAQSGTLSSAAGTNAQSVCTNAAITNITYTMSAAVTGVSVSGLPSGVTSNFSSPTLTISGTPTVAGAYTYTITTSGTSCTPSTINGTINVGNVLTLTSAAGTNNSQTPCNNSAITNITYSITGTATGASVSGLPTGVTGSYSSGTFTISGTPTVPGTYNYTVTTSGGLCTAGTATGTIVVNGANAYAYPGTPVIRYDFTSGATTNAGSTGATNAASLQGSPAAATDRFGVAGNAYSFSSASSQYVTNTSAVSVGTVFTSSSNFEPYTQSIWFKVANGYANGGGLLQFTNNQTGATSTNYDHNTWMNTAGNILFGIYNGGNPIIVSPSTYNDGKWHSAVATISSSGTAKLYMDGVQVASSAAFTGNNAGGEQYWRVGYTYLGGWPGSVTQNSITYTTAESSVFINGTLDDAALYNTELSSTQVAALYAQNAASAATTCTGNGATVTVTSYALATGTYTVTYNVSGTNTVSSTTATMNYTAGAAGATGSGTFTTSSLSSAGAANVVNITGLSLSGCSVSSLTLSTPAFTTNASPTLTGTSSSSTALCSGSTATITLSGLLGAAAQTVSYTIDGTAGTQTANLASGANTFNTIALTSANSGGMITITNIATATCSFAPTSNNTATLPVVSATPVAGTAASNTSVCNGSTATLTLTGSTGNIQWQSSTDNITFTNVSGGSGANTASYTTDVLNSGLYYRAQVTNGACTAVNSNAVLASVNTSNAGNGIYNSGWSNGQNDLTTGLDPWSLATGTNEGFFISSSNNGGIIDVNSKSWGEFANSGATASAVRPFSPALSTGNTIRFAMQNGNIDNGGTVGFGIQNGSGQNLLEFFFIGGQSFYKVNDASGSNATTIGFNNTGLNIEIAYTASNTYSMKVSVIGGSSYYFTGTFLSTGGSQVPAQVRFFNANAGNGSDHNAYYNSLSLNGPVIAVNPSSGTADYCQSTTSSDLSVTAYGSSLSYAWEQSSDGVSGWSAASGTNTAATYTPSTGTVGTLYYRVIVSGLCSQTDTSGVSGAITIDAAPSAPTNNDVTVTYDGLAHTASATVSGGQTIDWYAASSGGTALLTNSTSSPSATAAGVYTYYAEARNTTGAGCVSATRTLVTLTISQASLAITADDTTKVYGSTLTSGNGYTNFTAVGLVGGETIGTVTLTYGTGAAATDAVGTYSAQVTPSAATGGTFNAANYSISYISGAITVTPEAITITARDTSKVYGSVLTGGAGYSNYTVTSGALQNGETPTVTLTYGTGAAASDAVGTYSGQVTPSAATGGGFNAANYTITYASGSITVTPATLTITATDTTKIYGNTINGGTGFTTFTSSGLQNGETIGSVTIVYNSGSQAADAPGTYSGQVSISAATGGTFTPGNYNITYVPGNIIVVTYTTMWSPKGGGSTDWWDANNWTNGIIPDQYKSAMIATDSIPYPVLSADGTVYGLDLAGAATLDISSHTLTVDGPVTGTGTLLGDVQPFDPGAGAAGSSLVIGGTAGNVSFASGYQSLFNLTLLTNASATLATPLDIAAYNTNGDPGTLNVAASAVLNTGGGLTMKSDNYNTAQVTAVGNGASINGDVTVQRYIRSTDNPYYASDINTVIGSAKRAWRLMTAPVSGTQTIFDAWQNGAPSTYIPGQGTFITGPGANQPVNGLDGGLSGLNGAASLKGFDSTGGGSLINILNTKVPISDNSGNADNKGYFIFIRGDRDSATTGNPQFGGLLINNTTLSAKGKLQTGTQVFNVQSSTDISNKQFALIGNPYMSPVDLDSVVFTNMAPFVYTWDPGLNQVGGYVTLDALNNYQVSAPVSGSNQNQFIQSGQAFFVYGGLASGGPSSVTFNENSKASSNNNLVFRPATGAASFRSNLYLVNGGSLTIADGNLAQYDNTFCSCVDFYDAPKLPNINETFGLSRDGYLLSIERRPVISNPDTLFLNLTKTTQRNYSFHFIPVSMAIPGFSAFLKDSYLGDSTQVSLTDSTVVNFSIDTNIASQAADRFMIVFEPSGVVPVTYTNVKAWQQNSNVSVEWSVNNQLNIKSYDVETSADGITFTKAATVTATTQNNGTYDWIDANAVSGDNYYRIRSIGSNGVVYYSTIVKVKIGAGAPAIAVYPNPIRAGVIGLQMTNMAKGKYGIRLVDNIGQVLMATEVEHAGGSANQTIHYSNNLAKGVYHVEISGPDNYKNDIKVIN